MELFRLLDQFFDRGLCFATEGYDRYVHLQNGFQTRGREAPQAAGVASLV
jgi:hypothetical protein